MRKRHLTKQVGVVLSEETYNRLIHQTDKEEVTVSQWIREAIVTQLKNESIKLDSSLPSKNHSSIK